MSREDILLALRFVAMGRVNHPHVEAFADALVQVLATPEQRAQADMARLPVVSVSDLVSMTTDPETLKAIAAAVHPAPKRKKAD